MYERDVSRLTDRGDTRLCMPQRHEIYGVFLQFLEIFRGKYIWKYSTVMKNGFSLRQQQLQVIMCHIIT